MTYGGEKDYWEFIKKYPRQQKQIEKNRVIEQFKAWIEGNEFDTMDVEIVKDWFFIINGRKKECQK